MDMKSILDYYPPCIEKVSANSALIVDDNIVSEVLTKELDVGVFSHHYRFLQKRKSLAITCNYEIK